MVDKIASFVLGACAVADFIVGLLYICNRKWYAAGYWLAASVIVFCVLKGMK